MKKILAPSITYTKAITAMPITAPDRPLNTPLTAGVLKSAMTEGGFVAALCVPVASAAHPSPEGDHSRYTSRPHLSATPSLGMDLVTLTMSSGDGTGLTASDDQRGFTTDPGPATKERLGNQIPSRTINHQATLVSFPTGGDVFAGANLNPRTRHNISPSGDRFLRSPEGR